MRSFDSFDFGFDTPSDPALQTQLDAIGASVRARHGMTPAHALLPVQRQPLRRRKALSCARPRRRYLHGVGAGAAKIAHGVDSRSPRLPFGLCCAQSVTFHSAFVRRSLAALALYSGIANDTAVLIVFDTNVIIAALKSAKGASFHLIPLIRAAVLRPAVTAPLMFEYDDVANRPGLLPHLSPSEIAGFLDWFVSVSSQHKVHFLWRPLLRDPKDDLVLEAAVAASADYIVTFNTSDFDRASSLGVRVITPPQLLALIPSTLP